MKGRFLKARARQLCRQVLNRRAAQYNEDDLKRKAVVFSPHFDDETLGCGGTILRKTKAGAVVKIVFMTDGSKSHTHLISAEQSRTIRRREGQAAGRAMGLQESDIVLLDFEDTKLEEHWDTACDRVREILIDQRPEQVFIPYRKEPLLWSADHRATNRIVISALRAVGRKTHVYEYPIWFWCHWPWVRFPLRRRREIVRHWIDHSVLRAVDLLRDFRCVIPVKEYVERKRVVLAEHKSQMTRLIPDVPWRTLGDVADGEFLACFFQDYEVFHTYVLPQGNRDPAHV